MLALEYILVVPFACQLQSRRDEHNRALEYAIRFLSLISNSTGLKYHRISAQQKASIVVRNLQHASKAIHNNSY